MPCGIVGRKLEMTRIFQEDGIVTPITYIKCQKNIVSQVKSGDKCGYKAIVVATDECKRQTKTKKYQTLKEFSVEDVTKYKAGDEVPLKMLEPGSLVTVKGVGKGKGFQGVIKRHNFSRGPETHGSDHHRAPGSIGACAQPGRVFKGKKLPGRMGGKTITLKDITVVNVDYDNSLVALKGSVPGARNSLVQLILQA